MLTRSLATVRHRSTPRATACRALPNRVARANTRHCRSRKYWPSSGALTNQQAGSSGGKGLPAAAPHPAARVISLLNPILRAGPRLLPDGNAQAHVHDDRQLSVMIDVDDGVSANHRPSRRSGRPPATTKRSTRPGSAGGSSAIATEAPHQDGLDQRSIEMVDGFEPADYPSLSGCWGRPNVGLSI